MKVFGIEFSIPKNEQVFFEVTEQMLRQSSTGDIWGIVGKTEQISNRITIQGIHHICVKGEPYRIRVEFDPDITNPEKIQAWLLEEKVLAK